MRQVSINGIEVRDALTADAPGEDVLMTVDQGVDALLTESVDQGLHLSEVGLVELPRSPLNSLPHHSESHEIEAPFDEVI
jgi:hypothetical protein